MVDLNYLAILACGVATIIIGFIWYGPLFGKLWMRLTGIDKASPEEMEKGKKMMPVMAAVQFVAALVMAGVLQYVLTYAGAYKGMSGLSVGLETGFWMWLGFVVPVTIGMVLWEGKPLKLWLILAGNWIMNLLVMGAILSSWQ